ncbi:MAG: cell division protein ZapD [Gammaproteobacteria bacterium]
MSHGAASAPAAAAAGSVIVYEQPLSERMRTFLRLDFLSRQAQFHARQESAWSTRAAVSSLIEILAIVGRGDVRSDVLKELERQAAALAPFANRPGVDRSRLDALLERVSALRQQLSSIGAHYILPLKESEFLASVRHRSAIPGGTCEFDLPDFKHWLNLPYEQRYGDFQAWFRHIKPLCDAIGQLLWLTRESGTPKPVVAAGGMFQHQIDRNTTCQLVRVALPSHTEYFPEISGGQHRFTVRFLTWTGPEHRPAQASEDVEFELACC